MVSGSIYHLLEVKAARGVLNMNIDLLIIGGILLIFGYLIGVKQHIEFISFLRNKHIKDRKKVMNLLGGGQIVLGAVLITLGGLIAIILFLIVLFLLSIYVVRNLVE